VLRLLVRVVTSISFISGASYAFPSGLGVEMSVMLVTGV